MAESTAERVLSRVERSLEDIVDLSVERFFDQVPAYAASADPGLREDVVTHTRSVYVTVLTTIREHRPPTPADFTITQAQTANRLRAGIGLADFLRAFRIGQVTLWEGIVDAASEPDSWQFAVESATYLMNVIEVSSSVAAATYLTAQQEALADIDRVRRDLIEDLVGGREIRDSVKQEMLAHSGLSQHSPLLVAIAHLASESSGHDNLRSAVSALRGPAGGNHPGLTIVRQNHLIAILPVVGDQTSTLTALERGQRAAQRLGLSLSIGVSTMHDGIGDIPEAHHEAATAQAALNGAAGLRSLSDVSLVDYMVLRDDATAKRLINPELRQFIEEDLARDGPMIETLLAYINSDLNAKGAADQLHLHVNTAYYRLDRIAERTGYNLRRFADLEELLAAVRLLARADP